MIAFYLTQIHTFLPLISSSNMSHSWSMAEDVQLCVSYCRQSVDPISGNKQKIDNLWKKIHIDYYNNLEPNVNQRMAESRSQVSLAARFCKLKANLVYWGSCLAYAQRNKESGCNLQDEVYLLKFISRIAFQGFK